MYQVVNNLSHQAGAHALRVGVDFLYNDDTITYPRSVRGSYTFSSLANFLAGVYNNAGFTQTFGTTVVSQTNPNVGVYAQDEWKVSSAADAERRAALRPAVPAKRSTRTRTTSRRAWASPGRRSIRGAPWCAAAPGSSTIACRFAPSRTRCCRPGTRPTSVSLRQIERQPVPDAGRSARVSEHPERRRAVGHAGQPDDDGSQTCRTPIPVRRASRSSSSSASAAPSASATSTRAR